MKLIQANAGQPQVFCEQLNVHRNRIQPVRYGLAAWGAGVFDEPAGVVAGRRGEAISLLLQDGHQGGELNPSF